MILFPMPTMHLKFIDGVLHQLWFIDEISQDWKEVVTDEREREDTERDQESFQG